MATTTKTSTPATARKAPAKKAAPATKAPAKAAAKPAEAQEAPAPKKATPTQGPKLKWVKTGEPNDSGNCPSRAETEDGVYVIDGYDTATATWTPEGGKPEVLAENVSGKTAWSKCVAHHKAKTAVATESAA
jgi:hypothetical protein